METALHTFFLLYKSNDPRAVSLQHIFYVNFSYHSKPFLTPGDGILSFKFYKREECRI